MENSEFCRQQRMPGRGKYLQAFATEVAPNEPRLRLKVSYIGWVQTASTRSCGRVQRTYTSSRTALPTLPTLLETFLPRTTPTAKQYELCDACGEISSWRKDFHSLACNTHVTFPKGFAARF